LTLGGLQRAVFAVAIAATAAAAEGNAGIKRWDSGPTPALARTDLDGKPFDLGRFRGRVVVVNFWATWCEPCKEELPSLTRLKAKLADRPFDVVTVNFGEFPERITQYLRSQPEPLALPVLLDPQKEAANDWKVGGLPMTFIVDARGRVRYRAFGERDWSAQESVSLMEKLLAEVPRARR